LIVAFAPAVSLLWTKADLGKVEDVERHQDGRPA
jgi:hypothetical protein